jgi:hypothetical protein
MIHLPPEILQIIFSMDVTFRERYDTIVQKDIRFYHQDHLYYYIPDGIHVYRFKPRFWILETDTHLDDLMTLSEGKWKVLRLFTDELEWTKYVKNIEKQGMIDRVDWKFIEQFIQNAFLIMERHY